MTTDIFSICKDNFNIIASYLDKKSGLALFNTSKSLRIAFYDVFRRYIYFSRVYDYLDHKLIDKVIIREHKEPCTLPIEDKIIINAYKEIFKFPVEDESEPRNTYPLIEENNYSPKQKTRRVPTLTIKKRKTETTNVKTQTFFLNDKENIKVLYSRKENYPRIDTFLQELKNVKRVIISGHIVTPIENLPDNLEYLLMDDEYNDESDLLLNNVYRFRLDLPRGLLEFNSNRLVDDKSIRLNNTLRKLSIHIRDDIQSDYFPNSLTDLKINFVENLPIKSIRVLNPLVIPSSVKNLTISGFLDKKLVLPELLEKLEIDLNITRQLELPKNIKNLTIFKSISTNLSNEHGKYINTWKSIMMVRTFKVPSSVEVCRIGQSFNGAIDLRESKKLTHLSINGMFCEFLEDYIPEGLIELELYGSFGTIDCIPDILPNSLQRLIINSKYKDATFPSGNFKVIFREY